jgi:hypothetical protein
MAKKATTKKTSKRKTASESEDSKPLVPDASVTDFKGKDRKSHREQMQWVIDHLYVKSVRAKDAPDAESWAMLQLARDDPKSFSTKYWATKGRLVERESDKYGMGKEEEGPLYLVMDKVYQCAEDVIISAAERDVVGETVEETKRRFIESNER